MIHLSVTANCAARLCGLAQELQERSKAAE
jgi:hypothetical protein